ncbi:hypothetical protein EAE96_010840 [Botrytis aclada]|nr:hypothetical protein EAE96_010840 [Botrytis aclada]
MFANNFKSSNPNQVLAVHQDQGYLSDSEDMVNLAEQNIEYRLDISRLRLEITELHQEHSLEITELHQEHHLEIAGLHQENARFKERNDQQNARVIERNDEQNARVIELKERNSQAGIDKREKHCRKLHTISVIVLVVILLVFTAGLLACLKKN